VLRFPACSATAIGHTVTRHFHGEIRVASRIVDHLSRGLYESPAACLKELINNSYDADAETVNVFVKPDADRIIIEDDGHGMTAEEFERHFKVISESHKRDGGDETPSGRPKIGKIGIGFIAANEICNVMEILSTKKGSKELVHVSIHFDKMRRDPAERRREHDKMAEADYEGEVTDTTASSHYTKVFLKDVRGEAKAILAAARSHSTIGTGVSLYGLNPESVCKILASGRLSSWSELDAYSQTVMNIGLNVPVRYHEHWIPKEHHDEVRTLERLTAKLEFNVYYDGSEMRKPIVLEPGGRQSLARGFSFRGEHVSGRGYFYAQHGAIKPQNLNGLLIRIRNAAVGSYDGTFLDYPTSVGTIFQRWISAEIWADDRLEEAMNIDRKTLRTSHPAYLEFQAAVHAALGEVIAEARSKLYLTASRARKKERVRREIERLAEVSRGNHQPAAKGVMALSKQAESDADVQRMLLRKVTVAELYEIVLYTALETLSKQDAERFLREFTRRLKRN
jgi:histidine kinase/DNA gyrase B/HSP90-like ATPase